MCVGGRELLNARPPPSFGIWYTHRSIYNHPKPPKKGQTAPTCGSVSVRSVASSVSATDPPRQNSMTIHSSLSAKKQSWCVCFFGGCFCGYMGYGMVVRWMD